MSYGTAGYATSEDLGALFGDVRVVLMGGSTERMASIALAVQRALPEHASADGAAPKNIARSDRCGHGLALFLFINIIIIINHYFYQLCNDNIVCKSAPRMTRILL